MPRARCVCNARAQKDQENSNDTLQDKLMQYKRGKDGEIQRMGEKGNYIRQSKQNKIKVVSRKLSKTKQ